MTPDSTWNILSQFARLFRILGTVGKSTAKTPGSKVPQVRQPHGGALNVGGTPGNSGGKAGRSGRPPEPFRRFLARLRQDPEFHDALEKAAKDPESRGYSSALRAVQDYDRNKPAARSDVTSGGKPISGVVVLPGTE